MHKFVSFFNAEIIYRNRKNLLNNLNIRKSKECILSYPIKYLKKNIMIFRKNFKKNMNVSAVYLVIFSSKFFLKVKKRN